MNKPNSVIAFVLALSFNIAHAGEITIFKQWHLSPKQDTHNIEASTKLPQFANQESIYLTSKKLIEEGKSQLVISEGCEGEINKSFKETFNSWDYTRLELAKSHPNFDKILSLIPLKLEVLFSDKLLTLCGDNKALINEHQLALSDLRAYFGYITRLKQFKGKDEKRYKVYAEALKAPKGTDPLAYAQAKGKESLKRFKELIIKRNDQFIEIATKNADKNPLIIIGGLHAEDLEKRLKEKGLTVRIIEDATYEKEEKGLFTQLEAAFN